MFKKLSSTALQLKLLISIWSLCVFSSGTADANTAARAAIRVQSALRRDYDLLID
jgi:hypothetical protein